MRSVVAGEEDDSVSVKVFLTKSLKDLADIGVEASDHGSELCVGVHHGVIARAFLSAPAFVIRERLLITQQYRVVRLCELGMRESICQHQEERLFISLVINPFHSLLMNQVRRIAGAFEIVRSEHWEGGIVMEYIASHGGVASVSAEGVQEVRII